MFANSWSPRAEERRACWIRKAEEVASGRNRTLSYDATIASPASHAYAVSVGSVEGRHEGIIALAGRTPPGLDRGDEYGLIKRQSQLCLGHEYVLEGVWDGEENLYLGEDLGEENMVSESHEYLTKPIDREAHHQLETV